MQKERTDLMKIGIIEKWSSRRERSDTYLTHVCRLLQRVGILEKLEKDRNFQPSTLAKQQSGLNGQELRETESYGEKSG